MKGKQGTIVWVGCKLLFRRDNGKSNGVGVVGSEVSAERMIELEEYQTG